MFLKTVFCDILLVYTEYTEEWENQMSRKKTITGESIINEGFRIIKQEGLDCLNARHLAEEMGITTTPIFTNFGSMENLQTAIRTKAKKECETYLLQALDYPMVFKEFGMRFLSLAIDNPNVFKFVFLKPFLLDDMKEEQKEDFHSVFKPIIDAIRNPYNLNEDGISELIHILVTFTLGLAMTYIVGKKKPSEAAYGIMLSHLFDASCEYITKHQNIVSEEGFKTLLKEYLNSQQASDCILSL